MSAQAQHAPASPPVAALVSSPAQARQMAEGLIDVMQNLLDIVEQETQLVRAGKVREAMALDNRKNEASHRYMRAVSDMKHNRDYFKSTAPDLLSALHKHHDVFRAMLQVNLTVLATAHAVSEGIVRGVNGELQRRKMPQGYTAGGYRAAPSPRHATPLTISRTL